MTLSPLHISHSRQIATHLCDRPSDSFDFADENILPESDDPEDKGMAQTDRETHAANNSGSSDNDTPTLKRHGTDLTELARLGAIDPVVGREDETQRVIQILCRRKKNNPLLIGEPGVGKSAIVEGLAQKIASRQVPPVLLDKKLIALNMPSLVAGTQYRGQFEERIRRLLQELQEHKEVILFIDEIHTIIGAGSAPGSMDAANMLKPALARGEVQCIGATSTGEFKKSIEKDAALDRRFQKILVQPTSVEETEVILQRLSTRYEEHHHVKYTPEALKACVELTARYVTTRVLPDKAIDAMDEAGASARLLPTETPEEIIDLEQTIDNLTEEKLAAAKGQDYEKAAGLRDTIRLLTTQRDMLRSQWLERLKLRPQEVTEDDIAKVVSLMSGVPTARLQQTEVERLRQLVPQLQSKIIGQDKAILQIGKAIARGRMGLRNQDRPIGTFLFVGPTGVGKTYLVQLMAEWLFGSKDSLIRVDMSEYGEKFSVSRLVGAPPGYVGYDEGGQLTERVKRKPYSVVLLDEIEKAHPDVFNTLLQVMDEGRLTDGNGTTVDFRNTLIVLTSNSGTRQLRENGRGMGFTAERDEITAERAEQIIHAALKKQFAPEFLNRLDEIIVFNPLGKDVIRRIATLEIDKVAERIITQGFHLDIDDSVYDLIAQKGFDAQYGARALKRCIREEIEDLLCDYLLHNPKIEKELHLTAEEDHVMISHK